MVRLVDPEGVDARLESIRSELRYIRQLAEEKPSQCKRKTVYVSAGLFVIGDEQLHILDRYRNETLYKCSGERGNCGCIHAEIVALTFLLQVRALPYGVPVHVLCTNYSPCSACANAIVLSQRFQHVYFSIPTEHDLRGLEILRANGVTPIHVPVD